MNITDIFKSKGLKRTLASILAVTVPVMQVIPVLAPYAETVTILAGIFGLAGVTHAAVEGNLVQPEKK
jgi:putative copper export protein